MMKGGITSGVVYPLAALELAKEHRFRNIGGTSAGAIAGAAVAAAEFGRRGGGGQAYEGIATLPGWLGENLTSLFQPTRRMRPLFNTSKGDTIQIELEPVDRLDRDDADIAGIIVGIRDERPVMIDVIGTRAGIDEQLRAVAERYGLDAEALVAATQAALAAPDRTITLDVALRSVA